MRRRGLMKRIVSTALAAVLCVGMMGNVPMVSMAQENVEIETETATGSDADFGAGFDTDEDVEAPAFVDESEESEETTQEEADEEIIEDEEPSLTVTAEDWTYSDNDDGTVTITKYTGSDTEVVIPAQIDGKMVTGIGDYAFSRCSSLTSIKIPEGVASIGYSAFDECSNLTSIEIPSSVTSIESSFWRCSSLVSIDVNADNISYKSINGILYDGNIETLICCPRGIKGTVHIPESVTSIGASAFDGCSSLTSIEIPSSVTSIGASAFAWCSSLASIEIPEGVTSIERYAFLYCSSLTSIELPEGVTSIGHSAFEHCSSLTSIEIPKRVTDIGNYAFNVCSKLTSIEIPASVTSIGEMAFTYCSGLMSINVNANNENYKSVDGILYDGDMKTLICYPAGISGIAEIPTSVTSIGSFAFGGCSKLTSIEIPASVTSIGERAFAYCSGLMSINVNANNENYKSVNGILYDGDMTALILCPEGISGAVEIPTSVTSIGDNAFNDCSNLTSIEIPSGVTSIGDNAFDGCSGLTSVEIPEGVTRIDWYAFNGCSSLTDVKIPTGVMRIGYAAFHGCSKLTSIEIPTSVMNIEDHAFSYCSSLASIEIPTSVTSIGPYAFYDCDNLTICGFADSTAETYAKENDIPFVPLCEESDLSKVAVVADSVTYNADYQTAELCIMYKNNRFPLVEGVNYTGTVRRKAAGTTTVTIKGKGYYTGETTVSFTVNPLHLKNALEAGDVVFTAGDLEYTGRLLYSPVKVTYKGKVLKEGTDYTLKGNGRKAVGTSWAVVTGTGNYTGTIKVKYAMKKASQSKMIVYTKDARAVDVKKKGATVQLVASSVRDGAKIVYSVEKPNQGITVSSNGKVTVKKGTKPGKYRIKVLAQSTPYYKATSKYFTVVVK